MSYLVAPNQMVPAPGLDFGPDVQELGNAMRFDVTPMRLRLAPVQRRPKRQKAHFRRVMSHRFVISQFF
jgi:hypothetical protein